jgi:hypothetical protein
MATILNVISAAVMNAVLIFPDVFLISGLSFSIVGWADSCNTKNGTALLFIFGCLCQALENSIGGEPPAQAQAAALFK